MPRSPELTAGGGFTFEDNVAAFYLAALLAETYAPGINDRIVIGVSVQQYNFGEPLDDVIVDFEDKSENPARLSLQVKSTLTISSAKTNEDFRKIIRDSWATINKPDFRCNTDRYGVAVGRVTSSAKEKALTTLCNWARESLTADYFYKRFAKDGSANQDVKKIMEDVAILLEEAKGSPCTREEEHRFMAHFVLIRFDLHDENAINQSYAINLIKGCLHPDDVSKAPVVWSKIARLICSSASRSGQFDRMRLIRLISPVARLRGAVSLRNDLDKLTELSKSYVSCIPDDIDGIKLERTSLLEEMDEKLTTARIVLVSGLPGIGKSVLVKRAVQRALENGPVIFLKAENLEKTSWVSYAASQGLSSANLKELLVEIEVIGTPILFIDAIDRIEKAQRPIIIDAIRIMKESPLLDDWRIVASLRDTGIEMVNDWLIDYIDVSDVEMLNVKHLNEDDVRILIESNPHLRTVLFGSDQMKEIARRPFFAKILHKHYKHHDASASSPQSEVDLIDSWWQRGGYDKTGQDAIERQRLLIDLASIHGCQINHPIILHDLDSVKHINDLISDGIIQYVRKGISVRFAHDIFFEWAFFYVLANRGSEWMEIIKDYGEPPALARVVELHSQWEYEKGENWSEYLSHLESSDLGSQWLRAWLFGPLGSARFKSNVDQFEPAVFANDFRLFKKVIIWFQAEKIVSNKSILARSLPQEQHQRYADLLGWPSDIPAWQRLIDFILQRIEDIPERIYPEIVPIFDVWQNAFSDYPNPTSQALLQQCATWIDSIDTSKADRSDEKSDCWSEILDLDAFKKSLIKILLISSKARYSFAAEYLQRVTNSNHIRDDEFDDIIVYSPILAQYLPQSVVDLSLAFLLEELPDEVVAQRKMILPEGSHLSVCVHFNIFDWERLSIHSRHRNFRIPSLYREPFHSLFQSSPDHALQLLRKLCNHAMTAWRQLHRYLCDHESTPIPLELTFPWGTQFFWGNDREYRWFRSMRAPKPICYAFMALEEWCFSEIEKKRDVDDLIQQIVKDNECIAILGIASMIALSTERVSEAILPLITSQRLLTADHYRMVEDLSLSANFIDVMKRADKHHVEAIQAANSRNVRSRQLRDLVPKFIFSGETFRDRACDAIINFINHLPFQYEEHLENSDVRDCLTKQALEYAELVDIENYPIIRCEDDSDKIELAHVSPSAALPENIAKREITDNNINLYSLCMWVSKSLQENNVDNRYTINDAIVLSKKVDAKDLFENHNNENGEISLEIRRSAIVATAAIVLTFREGCSSEDLEWAHDVLGHAIDLQKEFDLMHLSDSVDSLHQGIFAAQGLAANIREVPAACGAANDLLRLAAHPLETVAMAALSAICDLWCQDSKLVWAALILAFSRCHRPLRPHAHYSHHGGVYHESSEAQSAVDAALAFYENGSGWPPLPLPPSAWVEVKSMKDWFGHQKYKKYHADDLIDASKTWGEPDVFWHSEQAKEVLNLVPLDDIINSSAGNMFLDFLAGVLDWTIQKNAPPWVKEGRRGDPETEIMKWTDALGFRLGHVAGLISPDDLKSRFLNPIFELEGENCWALLSPFTITYIRSYVYDASVIQDSTVDILDCCLGRFLQAPTFNRDNDRSGEFSGFHQPDLVSTLMFVLDERTDLSDGFENSEWTKISRVLPLIDRFVRAGGWAALVMDSFLKFCERTRANYPAEDFVDQVLTVIGDGPDGFRGWHGSSIPARIAELVQHFADRDVPMMPDLAQKFLRILDVLVDMGDRRSAALQQSNAFREIKKPL